MSKAAQMKTTPWELEVNDRTTQSVDAACVATSDRLSPATLLRLTLDQGFKNICQRHGHCFDQELTASHVLAESNDVFFESPVSAILKPKAPSAKADRELILFEQQFNNAHQKRSVLDGLTQTLSGAGVLQTTIDDTIAVADELFTNAVYNAPFVEHKIHINPGITRSSAEIGMGNGKSGRIYLAHDNERMVLGCEDPFGSLNMTYFLRKIRDSYEKGPGATMNFGPGGAGMGSYIIFDAASSLYFGIWPKNLTVLCCVIPLRLSYKKRTVLPKHLHCLQR